MNENWQIAIVGFLLTIGGGFVGAATAWAFKIHALVSSIKTSLDAIPVLFKKVEFHADKLTEHGVYIRNHDKRLAALEEEDCECEEE